MEGGIDAWNGIIAEGSPKAGMAFFSDTAPFEELIVVAWLMEEGARRFYQSVSEKNDDSDKTRLFRVLAGAEREHKASLEKMFRELSGGKEELPVEKYKEESLDDVMEGGLGLSEMLKWTEGRSLNELTEFALAIEAGSYDIYLNMVKKLTGRKEQKIFSALADEEKEHLRKMTGLFEGRA